MLKLLIKKQLTEIFRSYFYNPKNNKARSKAGTIAMVVFFVVLMVGILGGMFTFLSLSICGGLYVGGVDWLYFALMGLIAILLGAFGSVFNTFSGLYLSKDNDLLLSMPIPPKYIIISRLVSVYLMGAMYSATAILPALIVYWVLIGPTLTNVVCGLLLFLMITLVVLVLSCLLGWCVAKISLKLKNKSFVAVLASLAFIALYYLVYFRAQELLQDLLTNAVTYGEKIKGAAYGIYLFGRCGCGDWLATLICLAVTAALCGLTWLILKKTFISIATFNGNAAKASASAETAVAGKQRGQFRALLGKEFRKLTSSANYMLNCALGVLLIPAAGVAMLVKGPVIVDALAGVFGPGYASILICAILGTTTGLVDTAAPSVSLEAKNLWIPQSLPVRSRDVLRAKTATQLILCIIPMLFAAICSSTVLDSDIWGKLMFILTVLVYCVFSAAFSSFLGIKMPMLSWSNEIIPVKQSGAVALSIFGSWGVCAVFGVLYFVIGHALGDTLYLAISAVVFAALALLLLRWLDTKGAEKFDNLVV